MLLQPNQIDIWVAFADRIQDGELLSRYVDLLSADEHQRRQRFHFSADRHRYLVTRALVRTTLSHYRPAVAPDAWRFRNNAYGRPFLANLGPETIEFNVAHSGDLIAVAIGNARMIGFDIEVFSEQPPPVEIASRYFAKPEAEILVCLSAEERAARFLEIWTLKESFIKACGKGMSIPLHKFSFDLATRGAIFFAADTDIGPDAIGKEFIQVLLPGRAFMALCTEHKGSKVDVTLSQVIPLMTRAPLAHQVTRRSPT
jgi:4'-phosphopantetheinyl transferase